jgi:hypothetical protein
LEFLIMLTKVELFLSLNVYFNSNNIINLYFSLDNNFKSSLI